MTIIATTRRSLSWALRIGCAVHVIHTFFYEISETQGESMLPTLNYSGDFVHTNKLCARGRGCQVGDMIVALKPTDPAQRVCKRITGMPGDIIAVDPSVDFKENRGKEPAYIKVPEGHCWVTGDNLSRSLDSRSYGVLPLGLVKGKIVAVNTRDGAFQWLGNSLKPAED
ncbi:uncharacterized protein SAPINGB_P000271 [Magnusiomyces paraingens]|uniref:Mitochondrial inner membrane protease subunit n=1 Tax=Magnusiomyces paraingens TaxID=2606893 RepID=A0A5E8AZ41_9ASCO|nr:uncharacterized protein SAPINGB_P000271 [Saprochaete ingens]VVT44038.1 unnamed protein product [Saprochaete ingens]